MLIRIQAEVLTNDMEIYKGSDNEDGKVTYVSDFHVKNGYMKE